MSAGMSRSDAADSQVLDQAIAVLGQGGVLIYPTETLYAMGGDGRSQAAVDRVAKIKSRGPDKPFPLLIGDLEQLAMVTDWESPDLGRLTDLFWPGPLSVIVPGRPDLPRRVCDRLGRVSVRWSPHPIAQALSRGAGTPLVATSANWPGMPACAEPAGLDPDLVRRVDMVVMARPWPGGGRPSTVVSVRGPGRLQVHRQGAVSGDELRRAGFELHEPGRTEASG